MTALQPGCQEHAVDELHPLATMQVRAPSKRPVKTHYEILAGFRQNAPGCSHISEGVLTSFCNSRNQHEAMFDAAAGSYTSLETRYSCMIALTDDLPVVNEGVECRIAEASALVLISVRAGFKSERLSVSLPFHTGLPIRIPSKTLLYPACSRTVLTKTTASAWILLHICIDIYIHIYVVSLLQVFRI